MDARPGRAPLHCQTVPSTQTLMSLSTEDNASLCLDLTHLHRTRLFSLKELQISCTNIQMTSSSIFTSCYFLFSISHIDLYLFRFKFLKTSITFIVSFSLNKFIAKFLILICLFQLFRLSLFYNYFSQRWALMKKMVQYYTLIDRHNLIKGLKKKLRVYTK